MRHLGVVKPIILTFTALFGLLWNVCALADAPAAPSQPLTLADLVNRPDHWPPTVEFQHDLKFANGAVIHQGEKLRIVSFDGSKLLLISAKNMRVIVKPEDCGLLDAANQAWAALTPAQRAIDPDSLAGDLSLWPVQVKTIVPISCQFGNLPPGTTVGLVNMTNKVTDIAWPKSANRLNVGFDCTDVIDAARQLALVDPDKRPSRIAAALAGIMVDANDKPYHDDHLQDKKFFALYFGAGWCAPCHVFSPDLVKFLDEAMPKHPELAAVFLSEDHSPAEMFAYMKEENMPFPAVVPNDLKQTHVLLSYVGTDIMPDLVIVDRFGKVLAANDQQGIRGDPDDTIKALNMLLTAPATQP